MQFIRRFHHKGPTEKTTRTLVNKFKRTGSLATEPGQHPNERTEAIRISIERSPKSVRHLSLCHYVLDVLMFLNLLSPGRWIGRAGPLMWAARSHDLMPMDILCGDLSKDVCSPNAFPYYRSSGSALDKLLLP